MKIRPDVNDTLQNEGETAVRERLDRATKYNGPNEDKTRRKITATPYVWCDPKTIQPRDFLYGYHYVRRYVSLTVAMGGVGKSSEILTEVAAMITGRELLGIKPKRPLRVWYINLEDPRVETDRRLAAIFLHYGITPMDIGDRLFVDSGRETEMIIAREAKNGITITAPVMEEINATIRANKIDVVIVDPFVGSTEISENENNKIAQVCREWAKVAEQNNCAVELVHHVRKGSSGRNGYAIEDARGAGALVNSARSARVLNTMSREEGEKIGIEKHRSYFRIDSGKVNLVPPPEQSEWRRLVSVPLDNATADCATDRVGVVILWKWPSPLEALTLHELRAAQLAVSRDGPWRKDSQAKKNWVGQPIGEALGLDPTDKAHAYRIKTAFAIWLKNGAFDEFEDKDEKRMTRTFIKVGEWVKESELPRAKTSKIPAAEDEGDVVCPTFEGVADKVWQGVADPTSLTPPHHHPLGGVGGGAGQPAPVCPTSKSKVGQKPQRAGDGSRVFNDGVIGLEPDHPCAQCGRREGTVYLYRRGVGSTPLHEDCAAEWFDARKKSGKNYL
jgi:hypothetical protein